MHAYRHMLAQNTEPDEIEQVVEPVTADSAYACLTTSACPCIGVTADMLKQGHRLKSGRQA